MTIPQVKPLQQGFSLLEVLIAVVIIAVALLALSRSGQIQISALEQLRSRTLAMWVADNAITEARLQEQKLSLGFRSGSARMGLQDWNWDMRISQSPDPDLWRLDVVVRDQNGNAVLEHTGFSLRQSGP